MRVGVLEARLPISHAHGTRTFQGEQKAVSPGRRRGPRQMGTLMGARVSVIAHEAMLHIGSIVHGERHNNLTKDIMSPTAEVETDYVDSKFEALESIDRLAEAGSALHAGYFFGNGEWEGMNEPSRTTTPTLCQCCTCSIREPSRSFKFTLVFLNFSLLALTFCIF